MGGSTVVAKSVPAKLVKVWRMISPITSSNSAGGMGLQPLLLALLLATTVTSIESFTNHTVGGTSGWFFLDNTNTSATDYTKWADSQTFNLGDFLIFNTNSNQSVIQTYNQTTYKSCDSEDASDTDTFVYSGGDQVKNALTFAVPLTIEVPNYFFSDAQDGVQCAKGMAFQIIVKHGSGLPPSLNQPPPPPYVEPPTSSDTAEETPSSSSFPSNQQETFHNGAAGTNLGMGDLVIFVLWIMFLLLVTTEFHWGG